MRIEITGAIQHEADWQAFGEFDDLLAGDAGEVSYLRGQNDDVNVGDSSLALFFPAGLGKGVFAIGLVAPIGDSTGAIASLSLAGRLFISLDGGTLEVHSADYPPRPGLDPGLLRGTMTFRAVGLAIGTADTVTVRATFAAHWYHRLHPNVSVTLSGDGAVLGTSLFSLAQSVDDDRGGRLVWWDSDFDGVGGGSFPFEISQEFRLVAPAVGTYALANITPTVWADPALWPARFSALHYRDDPRVGLSTGGTLSIRRFVPPTDAYYGEIHGTLMSRLALWSDDTTVTSDTVNAAVTFAVQLWPLAGVPGSRARGNGLHRGIVRD